MRGPVGFFVPTLTVGGAERVTVTIANGLAERGYDVHLIVATYDGAFVSEVRDDVRVFDLDVPLGPGIGIGAALFDLIRYFRRHSPAIVFSQLTYASDICLLAYRLARPETAVVPTVHNTLENLTEPKDRVVRWLATISADWATQFVAVSDGVANSVVTELGVSRDRVSVLHNPIPVSDIETRARTKPDHRWFDDPDCEVVLGVGRLTAQKDFETFLEAFRRVHDARPSTRAVLVGRGPQRETLAATATELGIDDVVSFAGYVEDPYRYMGHADVLLMSSRHEGLPTVLVEALACGCPVVSTDCPSGPDTILDGGTYGRLAPVGDQTALADGVLATFRDPPDPATLKARARDFAPDTVLDAYETFIERHATDRPTPTTA